MLRKYLTKPRLFVVLIHAIGWILFLALPVIFLRSNNDSVDYKTFFSSLPYWLYVGLYAFIFYFHNLILLPRLYFRKRKALYFLSLILLGAAVVALRPFDRVLAITRPPNDFSMRRAGPLAPPAPYFAPDSNRQPGDHTMPAPPPDQQKRPSPQPDFFSHPLKTHLDIIAFFLYLLLIAMGVLTDGARRLQNMQRQLLQSESEKSRAELTFLKAQINPHFIFNTLNNLYSLAAARSEKTPETILKFSGIMRYIIDHMEDTWAPLADEIACINDYVDLQRLRLGKKVALQYTVDGHFEGKRVAPLILISFVENVFKYGTSNHEDAPLSIHISVQDQRLVFFSENKIFPEREIHGNGLGISNTRKRLDLMYPDKYSLDIDDTDKQFKVKLVLELNES